MIPFPLLFGAATLLILGKKKKRKSSSGGPTNMSAKYIGVLTDPGLNPVSKERVREVMEGHWEEMGKVLSGGGTHFVLMRDTAMELWPGIKWPLTINDEMRTVYVSPGSQIPAWIHNLGPQGEAAAKIWIDLRTLAWDITNYKPPT